MSYPEETGAPVNGEKKKKTWTVVTIILFILALPVILPIGLCIAGGVLALVLALGGGLLAVAVGAAGCVLAGLICLGALIICSVVGTGFGVVMLFGTPASGLAVLGLSLMGAGASVLVCILAWKFGKVLLSGIRNFVNWAGDRLSHAGKAKVVNDEK